MVKLPLCKLPLTILLLCTFSPTGLIITFVTYTLFGTLKKTKRNIVYAWSLLLLFVAGQYLVFSHTHKQGSMVAVTKDHAPTFKERCDVCDAMHHTHMLVTQQVYFTPLVAVQCHYIFKPTGVQLIQLVLASGRAPPVA